MALTADNISPHHYGGRYEYHVGGLWVVFDHVAASSRGIDAWVEVRWTDKVPTPRMLHIGRMDLMGSRTSSAIQRSIESGLKDVKGEWQDIINSILYNTVQDFLIGDPLVPLKPDIVPADYDKWAMFPLIGRSGATSLIGPGGTTKSLFGLSVALSIATGSTRPLQIKPRIHGPVAYLDWEADMETHAERLQAICRGRDMDYPDEESILYRQERQPLYRSANVLEKRFAQHGIVLAVVDSVMLARGGDAFGPEDTVRFYSALRQLGVPAVLVDHKSREAMRRGQTGAYGSVVNDNSARLQWEITAFEPQGPERILMKWEVTKRNNIGRVDPIAYDVRFTNGERITDTIQLNQIDPTTVVPLAPGDETQQDQVLRELRFAETNGMLVKELFEATGISDNRLRTILSQLKDAGKVMERTGMGRGKRWYAAKMDDQQEMPDPY